MKAAITLSTLALTVVLCAAGGHGGKHHKVSIVGVDPVMEGFGHSHDGFTFETFGGLQYSFLFHGRNRNGVFAAGTVIEQGERCGFKGVFSCGKGCGSEDPVCKAVFTSCGHDGAKCRSNEVCVDGTCHEYACTDGYKCFHGAQRVCEEQCREVCRDEKVYVCGNGFGGRRLAGGQGYNSGGDGAWGGSSGVTFGDGASGGVFISHNGQVIDPSSGGFGFDPSTGGFGFGHGGCGFITRKVCKPACEEVCSIREGLVCTEEICGSDPEMVACGRGYCRLGDMCYQPSCDHTCGYNKKYFCW